MVKTYDKESHGNSAELLIANPAITTTAASGAAGMGACWSCVFLFYPANLPKRFYQPRLKLGRKVHLKIFIRVMQQAISRGLGISTLDEQTICHQLQLMGFVWSIRCVTGFKLHWYQTALPGFHHVVRLSHQAKLMVQQGLRNLLPEVGIRVKNPGVGQPAFLAFAQTQHKQGKRQREQEQNQPP